MTRTLNSTWIARCRTCKGHMRIEPGTTVSMWNNRPAIRCCGGTMVANLLKSTRSESHECGARCLSAKGHVCECSCNGANHGSNA